MLSCISVNVYADSGLDDILPSSTSDSNTTDSTSDSSIEDFFESDTLDIEQEENNVTSNIEEINEEIFEGIGNGDVEENEPDNGLSIDNWIQPLAIDMSIPSRYTGTGGFANGYFTLWQLNGGSIDPVAMNRSYNRDMSIILNQLKISFGAVATTLQRLDGAIDTRISTDSYLLGRIDENFSSINNHASYWRDQWATNKIYTDRWKNQFTLNNSYATDISNFKDYWTTQWATNAIYTGRWQDQWKINDRLNADTLNYKEYWKDQWEINDKYSSWWREQWETNEIYTNRWKDQWLINDRLNEDSENNKEHWKDQWATNEIYTTRWTNQATLNNEFRNSWEDQLLINDRLTEDSKNNKEHWKDQWATNEIYTTRWTNQASINNRLNEDSENFKSYWRTQWSTNETYTDRWNEQSIFNTTQIANNISQGDRITELENEINNFNFSDLIDLTVLVNAINSFKKAYTDSISEGGDLFNLIRGAVTGQTTSLIGYFNGLFNDYFGNWENSIFWVQYGLFEKRHMAIFIEVFLEELDLILDKYWLEQLETWNITNDILLTGNNWLEMIYNRLTESYEVLVIITNWLDEIYKKSTPIVPPIPFDYARLENMLKKLEFGEIVNEAGTNIWDFLSDLIKEMSSNFRTAITEMGDILKDILDFLDGFLDRIMALLVPEDMDFMRDGFEQIDNEIKLKFSWFFTIGYKLSEIFQPSNKDFIPAVSFNFMGNEFKPNVEHLNMFVPQFRSIMTVFIWLYVSWFVYKRFTGTGDIINDN